MLHDSQSFISSDKPLEPLLQRLLKMIRDETLDPSPARAYPSRTRYSASCSSGARRYIGKTAERSMKIEGRVVFLSWLTEANF
jgi:hypothetical protein